MSARVVGWELTCDLCGARYVVIQDNDISLYRVRESAAAVGWWAADDREVKLHRRRDLCPACKFSHREQVNAE